MFVLLGVEAIKAYRANPTFGFVILQLSRSLVDRGRLGPYFIPTWTYPLAILLCVTTLVPNTSFLGHLCSVGVGYICRSPSCATSLFVPTDEAPDGLGYLKILAPPEKILRWLEGKLNLLGRLPHYVSVDQKTYGRYGVLPTTTATTATETATPLGFMGTSQRLGS